ncbi:Na+-transporting methylmalonyl-CoA/oxaloacetate decarboxylase gamma subunit [Nocardioides salarius]|uniref:Na+-transporting methylmalonyl-CoA/oxaloacetate decarboxylase gamma subunit n=1 Tax=Nocardioides salarius TaxID=374513 RepID=A0ABS2MAT9_9ACTN|nr:FtsX-like permease family protein [Nocardioides salarius]MBM7508316.1 Na+-transporting methylmalonyl-CoA/oxaloacetate decarboxylase gamma subunit [Nocardioides salarius]
MTRALTRDLARTLRGAWSRRGTLAPLLALTTVVVAGVVAVLGFSEAAGTSGALAVPLLLLALVALPTTGRELAAARRGEIALARLRGLEGGELYVLLALEPLLVLVLGGLLGGGLGLLVAHLSASAWLTDPAALVGTDALTAAVLVVLAGLVALLVGMGAALREPLADQVAAVARPRRTTLASAFAQVLVVVGAAVAVYRSSVTPADDAGGPDLVVLAGPALVGLAVGAGALWLLRLLARRWVRHRGPRGGLAGFLAARRLDRVAGAAGAGGAVQVLVAAAVVAGVALTAAVQVEQWTERSARLVAGAPLRIDLETDAEPALELTRRLDPDGRWLMAAVLVPGEGSVPARRAFLDLSRHERVLGGFHDDTSAAGLATVVDELVDDAAAGSTGPVEGTDVVATVSGVSRRLEGRVRPEVLLTLRDVTGGTRQVRLRLEVGLDGAPATASAEVGCAEGCEPVAVTLQRRADDSQLPWTLDSLVLGDQDLLERGWSPAQETRGDRIGGPVPVAGGLLAVTSSTPLVAVPDPGSAAVPVLATRSATWDGEPVLDSPGGLDLPAQVVARVPALPLVQADGVLADLPRALVGSPPTVPVAEVALLARADTPPALLDEVLDETGGELRTLEQVRAGLSDDTGAAQARVYLLVAGFGLLVALLVLGTAVARERPAWLRDVAALRVVGLDVRRVRGAVRLEVAGLVVVSVGAALLGTAAGVLWLLGDLALVEVPDHAVALRTSLDRLPVLLLGLVVAAVVALVVGRGRRPSAERSRPAVLREEAAR